MSRFDGWLVRFIVMHGTPAAMTVRAAAKNAGIRKEVFGAALRDSKLVRADARHLGIDPDEMRAIYEWMKSGEHEQDVAESMVQSAAAVKRTPSSERYKGSKTRLGVTCPGRTTRDNLGLPINRIEHPEPEGEWHDGLNDAGCRLV